MSSVCDEQGTHGFTTCTQDVRHNSCKTRANYIYIYIILCMRRGAGADEGDAIRFQSHAFEQVRLYNIPEHPCFLPTFSLVVWVAPHHTMHLYPLQPILLSTGLAWCALQRMFMPRQS